MLEPLGTQVDQSYLNGAFTRGFLSEAKELMPSIVKRTNKGPEAGEPTVKIIKYVTNVLDALSPT